MRLLPNRLLLNLLAVAMLAAASGVAPVAAAEPVERVKAVDAALLEAMKRADELGFEGRYELLEPVLEENFDFRYMAQVAIGRHWQELEKSQKQALIEAFREMSVATFASRFDGYSGESFEVGEARDAPRGMRLVSNRLERGEGDPVSMDFLLHESDGAWRIVDVLLDAKYSELATRRSEYTSVVDSQGFGRLLELLERKVADLRRQG